MHKWRYYVHGSTEYVRKRPQMVERFWAKVQRSDECWLWQGARFVSGYGKFSVRRIEQMQLAHRVAYELTRGKIPPGMHVCHDCDRYYPPGDTTYRRCVRPDHLFLATNAGNQYDKVAKGRQRAGQGERHGHAKLVAALVLEIRTLAGTATAEAIAPQYGVTASTIYNIWKRRTWRHLA